jgi:phospholipase C
MRDRNRFLAAAGTLAMVLTAAPRVGAAPPTETPIKHVIVIFQENVSFDHYFGTYPNAANNDPSEPQFTAAPGTPTVNGLMGALLPNNPNGVNPFRFTRAQAATCDQDHDYSDEQTAFDSGLMDNFLALVPSQFCTNNDVNVPNEIMGYFDGNTVTALWNYVQNFAMNDNSFSTTCGPSTPGAINLAAGNTFGAMSGTGGTHNLPATAGDIVGGSAISDGQPSGDVCASRDSFFYTSSSKNIGDLEESKMSTGKKTLYERPWWVRRDHSGGE